MVNCKKTEFRRKKQVATGGGNGTGEAIANEFPELGAEIIFTAANSATNAMVEQPLKEIDYCVQNGATKTQIFKR